jgi:hypothetical protein
MAAFNWIEFEEKCPVCLVMTCIRAQSHIAASFEGDNHGRFCQQTYRVGEKMRWLGDGNNNYNKWMTTGAGVVRQEGAVFECCYANCIANGDRLYAVVKVENLIIGKIVEMGPEDDWPVLYPK